MQQVHPARQEQGDGSNLSNLLNSLAVYAGTPLDQYLSEVAPEEAGLLEERSGQDDGQHRYTQAGGDVEVDEVQDTSDGESDREGEPVSSDIQRVDGQASRQAEPCRLRQTSKESRESS